MPESLELETQVFVSYLTRVLETELTSVLNHFFPLPLQIFLKQLATQISHPVTLSQPSSVFLTTAFAYLLVFVSSTKPQFLPYQII